jgi:hypothetical protein
VVTTGGTAAYDVNMNIYVFHKELRPLGAHSTTKHELDVLQMSLIAAGDLRPVVDRVFPLAEAVGPTALWPHASTSARSSSASSTDQHARARVANRVTATDRRLLADLSVGEDRVRVGSRCGGSWV